MCLNESVYKIVNIGIVVLSIILSCAYLLYVYNKFKKRKKKRRKFPIRFYIIAIILCLLINGGRELLVKKCPKIKNVYVDVIKNKDTTTTSTTTTMTTTSTTTKTTAKKKTTTTTKKENLKTGTSSKGYSIEYKNGAYYVDNYMIANKSYALASDFVPSNTHKKITDSMKGFCRECIDKEAYEAWIKMKNDATALNLNLWIQSGYRSYDYQKDLYDGYVKKNGKAAADLSSSRPGHSEHQTALAFDLNTITTSFKDTDEGIWVNKNAYLYGYIIRYPNGKNDETGYKFEPWHIRYVGKELAKALYNNGSWITMEDYFGIDSKY